MEKLTINVVSYKLLDLPSHQDELDELHSQNAMYEYQAFTDLDELFKFSSEAQNVFFIFNIVSKTDYILIQKYLLNLKKKKVLYKAICFFDFDNEKALGSLYKLDVANVLNTSTSTKNFIIKVNMVLRSFEKKLKDDNKDLNYVHLNQQEEDFLVKSTSKKKTKKEPTENLHPTEFGFGEASAFKNDREILDSKFATPQDDGNEARLIDYIDELGINGKLNIQQGHLEIKLGGDCSSTKCSFESFYEESIILGLEGPIDFKENDTKSIYIKFIYEKCKVEIELEGIVVEIERHNTNSRYVSFSLGEFGVDQREYFMSLYEMRQKSIHEFMMLARGIA